MAMENAVPQSSPDLEESHPYWEFVIRVLFYKQPSGDYRTWCYIGDSVTRESFPMDRDFGTRKKPERLRWLKAGGESSTGFNLRPGPCGRKP